MTPNAIQPKPAAGQDLSGRPIVEGVRRTLLLVLTAILALCLLLLWQTRDAMEHLPFLRGGKAVMQEIGKQKTLVDLSAWQTALELAPLAVSAEEVELAREAERLADHDTDQAFAAALRQAAMRKPVMTPRAQELAKRIADLQAAVAQDDRQLKALPASAGEDAVAIAKAQLGLDTDELKDAQDDLVRESGDDRPRIQQELASHEATMRKYDAQGGENGQAAVISMRRYGTLSGRLSAWKAQRSRYALLRQAQESARRSIETLTAQHDTLEAQADSAVSTSASKPELVASAAGAAASGATPQPPPQALAAAGSQRLDNLHRRTAERQLLSIYDDRISTEQQLSSVYGKWADQVALQHRIVGHLLLQSLATAVGVLMAVLIGGAVVQRWTERPSLDRRRMQTLRTVLSLGVQVVGVVILLLITFGAPRQTPTIVGLATAGLTVVLQDFILAFFGWFVLMGRHGISVGDAVEIDGVNGEVVEIGLFRTTLLETGNWTDQGHPTGRRVAIINKFAMNGRFFNFSTAGQWLWDEMVVGVGSPADPYANARAIQAAVTQETEEETQMAQQDWDRAGRLRGLNHFDVKPEVNLRPGAGGMEIVLRYMTRASKRVEMRNRLYQRVLDVLHGPARSTDGEAQVSENSAATA